MYDQASLVAELDTSLGRASDERRVSVLRRVTALFAAGASSYSSTHVALYDLVMAKLIERLEPAALSELSSALAAIQNAPPATVGRLAQHPSVAVAGPVLEASDVLADSDLTEIAKVAGPGHLLAIAGRARVSAAVADVLLERRNPAAIHKLIGNLGATLSDVAFVKLVNDAKRDKTLATLIETRPDLPEELKPFLCLLK